MSITQSLACRHCGNISKPDVIGEVFDDQSFIDPHYGPSGEFGVYYLIWKCPACIKANIVSYNWNETMESEEEIKIVHLYPVPANQPVGLPPNILTAYLATEKVKSVDVNAYAILTRRLLELVCLDRAAKAGTLAAMLKELADKHEIPQKLVKVAEGLKDFGNIGAHAGSGELTEKQIPIVSSLCTAILEYVYSAPHLATLAESQLKSIKTKVKKS